MLAIEVCCKSYLPRRPQMTWVLLLKAVYQRWRSCQLNIIVSCAFGGLNWTCIVLGSFAHACRLLFEALLNERWFYIASVANSILSGYPSCTLWPAWAMVRVDESLVPDCTVMYLSVDILASRTHMRGPANKDSDLANFWRPSVRDV